MEWLIFLALCAFLFFKYMPGAKQRTTGRTVPRTQAASPRVSHEQRLLTDHLPWLEQRWQEAEQSRGSGGPSVVPNWFYDGLTDRQQKRLTELEVDRVSGRSQLTKGQASDVIGLFAEAEEHDIELLRFFKAPTKGLNQTTARYEAAKLRFDAEKMKVWEQRTSNPMQKECLRFLGVKPAASNMTHAEAERLISARQEELADTNQQLLDDWDLFESLVEELDDPDNREDYELKKPPLSAIRAAVESLRQEGHTMAELEDDLQLLADRILQLKPELRRAA